MSSVRLILDSGAFAVWRKAFNELRKAPEDREDIHIDLEAYIDAIKYLENNIYVAINLDVKPGQMGRVATLAEVESSAAEGWDNLMTMERAGIHPIPVYHQGESIEWLKRMLEWGYDYIGLSPENKAPQEVRRLWLEDMFEALCDKDGLPCVRIHGFAVTSPQLMARFPWFSVDSASSHIMSGHGKVLLPNFTDDGQVDFRTQQQTFFSSRILHNPGKGVLHYRSFSGATRRYIDKYLEDQGLPVDKMAISGRARDKANVRYFKLFLQQHKPQPFASRRVGFFRTTRGSLVPGRTGTLYPLSVFISYRLDKASADVFDEEQYNDRLISYANFMSPTRIESLRQKLEARGIRNGQTSTH